jgi:cytoskeletal protein CcmA (bactofilin family)
MENVAPDSNRSRNRYGSGSITLGPRDSLEGKLILEGDLQVFGSVQGELKISGDLSLEDGSTVRASVHANNVSVRGSLEGEVTAHGRLLIAGSGGVSGNVRVSRLAVEDGATFNGNISMHSGTGTIETMEAEPVAVGENSENHQG